MAHPAFGVAPPIMNCEQRGQVHHLWAHICRFWVALGGADLVRGAAPALALGGEPRARYVQRGPRGGGTGHVASCSCVGAPGSVLRGRPGYGDALWPGGSGVGRYHPGLPLPVAENSEVILESAPELSLA
jgi:hypothetical protein